MAADEDERRLIALGRVAENSANLEMTLRMALCALVGSKYAAIVAAGQQTAWLIEQSRAIVKAHREISPEDRARLIDILEACAQANASRRTLIHHAWGTRPPDDAAQLGSSYRDYRLRVSGSITAEHVESVAHELQQCDHQLHHALVDAVGPEAAGIEAQLRWEDYVAASGG